MSVKVGDEARASYLQLSLGEGCIGGAEAQNVDEARGRKGLDALVLVVEKVVAGELLGHLGQGLGVERLLVEVGQLTAQGSQPANQLLRGDGPAWPPRERLVEAQPHQKALGLRSGWPRGLWPIPALLVLCVLGVWRPCFVVVVFVIPDLRL